LSAALLITANKEKIKLNPFSLSGNLYPFIDNGYGEMIEDTTGVLISVSYVNPVRISHRKRWGLFRDSSGTPVNIEIYEYFMISDNKTIVDEDLIFVFQGVKLKVTQRKPLIKYNTIIGYEYELKNLTEGSFNA